MKDKDDLNVKGAYLHMAADALVSVGVLVSGLVISWTGWTIVDPCGTGRAAVIVASVWSLRAPACAVARRRARRRSVDELERKCAVPGVKPSITSMSGHQYDRKRPDGPCRAQACPGWKR
ncbi:MAG: cation transporter [Alistipes finegoldii]